MRKSGISLISLFILVLSGCSKDNTEISVVEEKESKTFVAFTESYSPQTRTSRDSEGNVLWKMGDQVSIFVASTINEQYQVSDGSDGKTSASLNRVGSPGFVAGSDLPANIAFYPYSASNEIAKSGSGYTLTVTLPETQSYAVNTFGNGAFPMAAVTASESDMNLKFKNVLGGLKLQLKGTAIISRITVSGNNDEIMCGAATVTASNTTTPTVVLSDATKKHAILDCGSGVQLNTETATTFIIALPPMIMSGGFTIDIYDNNGGSQQIKSTRSQTITRSALLAMPEVTVAMSPLYAAVDLGLSVKWATFNVGATAPEEYGDYFAWGETEPYYEAGYAQEEPQAHWKDGKTAGYEEDSYKYCNGGSSWSITKYCSNSYYGYDGYTDTKTILDPEDDVAHVKWGDIWRMPTEEEFDALITNCTWTWCASGNIEFNGVAGYKVTSNISGYTDHFIFLPAAGWRSKTRLFSIGEYSYYWTSSLNTTYPNQAMLLYFKSDKINPGGGDRLNGLSVRPVCP